MKKKAFITGISGQDAAYLAKFLLDKGYEVYGGLRRSASGGLWRLQELGIAEQVKLVEFELTDIENVFATIQAIQPDELYSLAAMSHVGSSFKAPLSTLDITGMGVVRIIVALSMFSPDTKMYQASTSEMFGGLTEKQDETTPFHPRSPYGVAKLMAHSFGINYRESYGLFIAHGILFNHEGPLRGLDFVTRKITDYIGKKLVDPEIAPLELGNLYAKRDWGHAKDYVRAMWMILQQEKPDDYVIATGETHTIKEFVEQAFRAVGIQIKWEGEGVKEVGKNAVNGEVLVKINPKFYRPAEVETLCGNPTKAKQVLGWEPAFTFSTLVKNMVTADVKRYSGASN